MKKQKTREGDQAVHYRGKQQDRQMSAHERNRGWVFFALFVLVFPPVMGAIQRSIGGELPVAEAIGVDPIHFGIIMCVNLAIGFVTPPMGANLFVASNLSKVSVFDIARKAVPFILAFLIALLLITFVPQISMFLLQ